MDPFAVLGKFRSLADEVHHALTAVADELESAIHGHQAASVPFGPPPLPAHLQALVDSGTLTEEAARAVADSTPAPTEVHESVVTDLGGGPPVTPPAAVPGPLGVHDDGTTAPIVMGTPENPTGVPPAPTVVSTLDDGTEILSDGTTRKP